ncbi:hypothetical protein EI42_02222 [Thermosporothrix hazakensis]|jgi:hypothetical protein|uniref:Uncharacterized protein n=2 Tax=Thermosporothrix TaxID=768650 RepID=A0A326UMJ2_THEHA|nr:hypothetical protein [Thermosporothrix hazakensis]PZW31125.1 hypothetical protein EI42_02222 [Thermosporothrix hazakensis]BBH86652.1 hypothetical protein KTC_14030 [Thermosporothrix sp. COM3]GCE50962.1 hypothetical protein KTH_58310 [Thermosporothrix hazakensis]
MNHEEIQRFFEHLVETKAICQLTPGIRMQVEEVDMHYDKEKNLHVVITVGDEDYNDYFEMIFPAQEKKQAPSSKKPRR